ncbi:hypothetical protein CHUAL_004877 [Chamberlinius hualienensis]
MISFLLEFNIGETDSQSEEKIAERQRWNRELEERRKLEESRKLAAERDLRTRAWVQEVSRTFYANYPETQHQEEDNNHRVSAKRPTTMPESNVAKKPKNSGGGWKGSLKGYLNSHDSSEFADEKVVIIKDKYPKARHHYLVLPKENIPNLSSLRRENVDILHYMLKKGQEIAGKCHPESRFRLGFHAVHSMSHLHLHVISQDMDSVCLKTKKHWNSFVTEYFVDAEVVIQQLEKNGSYNVISAEQGKALLNTPLRCHQCNLPLPTMPKLKQHILTHFPK